MENENGKINSFLSSNLYDPGESFAGNGTTGSPDPGLGEMRTSELLERQGKTLQAVKKTALKVVEMVDGGAKRAGLPGVGETDFQEDYVDVGMTWVEQMAGDPNDREKIMKFLKKAPGLCFGILSVGIASRNALAATAKDEPEESNDE